jgi:hypothetical protein
VTVQRDQFVRVGEISRDFEIGVIAVLRHDFHTRKIDMAAAGQDGEGIGIWEKPRKRGLSHAFALEHCTKTRQGPVNGLHSIDFAGDKSALF